MDPPSALSLEEIRKYMLLNNCKVTNHALVKHFRKFLTNPDSQEEARKLFKSYVNILATMKNENNEKFLVLRKKYLHECPPEDIINKTIDCPSPASPGNSSIASESLSSPFRQPPPYKPPPEVSPNVSGLPKVPTSVTSVQQANTPISYGIGVPREMTSNYRECVNEFAAAVRRIDPNRIQETASSIAVAPEESLHSNDIVMQEQQSPPVLPPRKRASIDQNSLGSLSRENSIEENKENVNDKGNLPEKNDGANRYNEIDNKLTESENQISVKEATRKFNRMASEEEAKVVSPPSKKKPEKTVEETPEVTLAHPKAKEWLVSAAKANYQELAKLLADHPELVRLQDPSTGYTGLHWAAKHGNEDVVKLIAGTYKADVNARTNGGYTPLHLAMQFGRDNIFELLCNVYKANRDITDWSGNKPLDYRRQRTTVSASTYSSEYFELLLQNQQQSNNLQQYPGSLKHKKRSQPQRSTTFNTYSNNSPLQRAKSLMIGKNKKHSPILNRKEYKHYNINKRISHNIPNTQYNLDDFDEVDEGLAPATLPTTADNNLTTLPPPLKDTKSSFKKKLSSKKSFKN